MVVADNNVDTGGIITCDTDNDYEQLVRTRTKMYLDSPPPLWMGKLKFGYSSIFLLFPNDDAW